MYLIYLGVGPLAKAEVLSEHPPVWIFSRGLRRRVPTPSLFRLFACVHVCRGNRELVGPPRCSPSDGVLRYIPDFIFLALPQLLTAAGLVWITAEFQNAMLLLPAPRSRPSPLLLLRLLGMLALVLAFQAKALRFAARPLGWRAMVFSPGLAWSGGYSVRRCGSVRHPGNGDTGGRSVISLAGLDLDQRFPALLCSALVCSCRLARGQGGSRYPPGGAKSQAIAPALVRGSEPSSRPRHRT